MGIGKKALEMIPTEVHALEEARNKKINGRTAPSKGEGKCPAPANAELSEPT